MSDVIGGNARQQLLSVIERVENVEAEMKVSSEARREIYAEAKSNGYDVSALKVIVRQRKEDREKRAEREANVESYSAAIDHE